jgi:hypothetical protein
MASSTEQLYGTDETNSSSFGTGSHHEAIWRNFLMNNSNETTSAAITLENLVPFMVFPSTSSLGHSSSTEYFNMNDTVHRRIRLIDILNEALTMMDRTTIDLPSSLPPSDAQPKPENQ